MVPSLVGLARTTAHNLAHDLVIFLCCGTGFRPFDPNQSDSFTTPSHEDLLEAYKTDLLISGCEFEKLVIKEHNDTALPSGQPSQQLRDLGCHHRRPIPSLHLDHWKQDRSGGHLFISVLACQLVQVIRSRLWAHCETASRRTQQDILSGQIRVTACFRRADRRIFHIRRAGRPGRSRGNGRSIEHLALTPSLERRGGWLPDGLVSISHGVRSVVP